MEKAEKRSPMDAPPFADFAKGGLDIH
jgi:hypothetical protein